MNLKIKDEYFGDFLPFIKNEDITDINWNGAELWIDDLKKGRYMVRDFKPSASFLDDFCTRIGNLMNKNFNDSQRILEAETDELRLSFIHENGTGTGRSISIRKTPALNRLNSKMMIEDNYCSAGFDNFMKQAIAAHMNIVIAGTPGVGKTEYLKRLTNYIPAWERAITIEDNFEIRYREINPGKDCVAMKVDDVLSYTDCIKASLRQLPNWLLLSEARSVEVKSLLEAYSTGVNGITTIHTDDARKIPDRIENMIANQTNGLRDNIYSFIDIGILIRKVKTDKGIVRRIEHACFFDRTDGKNTTTMFYEKGKFLTDKLPEGILAKFRLNEVSYVMKDADEDCISKDGIVNAETSENIPEHIETSIIEPLDSLVENSLKNNVKEIMNDSNDLETDVLADMPEESSETKTFPIYQQLALNQEQMDYIINNYNMSIEQYQYALYIQWLNENGFDKDEYENYIKTLSATI